MKKGYTYNYGGMPKKPTGTRQPVSLDAIIQNNLKKFVGGGEPTPLAENVANMWRPRFNDANLSPAQQRVMKTISNLPIYTPDVRWKEYQDILPYWQDNIRYTPVYEDRSNFGPNDTPSLGSYFSMGTPSPYSDAWRSGNIYINPSMFNPYDNEGNVVEHETIHAGYNGGDVPEWMRNLLQSTNRNPGSGRHENILNEQLVNQAVARRSVLDEFGLPDNAIIPEELSNEYLRRGLYSTIRNPNAPAYKTSVSEAISGNKPGSFNKVINYRFEQPTTETYGDEADIVNPKFTPAVKNGGDISLPNVYPNQMVSKYGPGGETTDGCPPWHVKVNGECVSIYSDQYKKLYAQGLTPFITNTANNDYTYVTPDVMKGINESEVVIHSKLTPEQSRLYRLKNKKARPSDCPEGYYYDMNGGCIKREDYEKWVQQKNAEEWKRNHPNEASFSADNSTESQKQQSRERARVANIQYAQQNGIPVNWETGELDLDYVRNKDKKLINRPSSGYQFIQTPEIINTLGAIAPGGEGVGRVQAPWLAANAVGVAAAPLLVEAAPIVGAALNAPIGGVAGLTANNLINAGFAYHGLTNTLPQAYKDFSNGDYIGGTTNLLTGAIETVPFGAAIAPGVKATANEINSALQSSKQLGTTSSLSGKIGSAPLTNDPFTSEFLSFSPEEIQQIKNSGATIDEFISNRVNQLKTPEGQKRLAEFIKNNKGLVLEGTTPADLVKKVESVGNLNKLYYDDIHTYLPDVMNRMKTLNTDLKAGKLSTAEYETAMQGLHEEKSFIEESIKKFEKDYSSSGYLSPEGVFISPKYGAEDIPSVVEHETMGHLFQDGTAPTNFDKELESLELLDQPYNMPSSTLDKSVPADKRSTLFNVVSKQEGADYFPNVKGYFQSGSRNLEKYPQVLELRQQLLREGKIKSLYDPIPEEMLVDQYTNYMNLPQGIKYPLRVYDIMKNSPANFKLLSNVLNRAPAVIGATAAGAAAGQVMGAGQNAQPAKQAYGGSFKYSFPRFNNGGTNQCPEGQHYDATLNKCVSDFTQTEFLTNMANSKLFPERYAAMTGRPLNTIDQSEIDDYRNVILNNLKTLKYAPPGAPPAGETWNRESGMYAHSDQDRLKRTSDQFKKIEKQLTKAERKKFKDQIDNLQNNDHTLFVKNKTNPYTVLHEESHGSTRGNENLRFGAKPFKMDFTDSPLGKNYNYTYDVKYTEDPTEIKSRRDLVGKYMLEEKLWDPYNEPFTEENYNKLRQKYYELYDTADKDERSKDVLNDLRQVLEPFSKEEVIRMFNSFVKNDQGAPQTRVEYGGPLVDFYKGRMTGPNIFAGGGELTPEQLASLNRAKMRSKMALAAEFGNPSARRMMNPTPPSYRFSGNEMINGQNVVGFGNNQVQLPATGTHFMGSMGNFAVPYIQQDASGKMIFNPNASFRDREAIRFGNPEDAQYFAEHYKEVAPMMQSFAQGGQANKYFYNKGYGAPHFDEGGFADCPCPQYPDCKCPDNVQQGISNLKNFYNNRPANIANPNADKYLDELSIKKRSPLFMALHLMNKRTMGYFNPLTDNVGYVDKEYPVGYGSTTDTIRHEGGHKMFEELSPEMQKIVANSILPAKAVLNNLRFDVPQNRRGKKYAKYLSKPTEFYTRRNNVYKTFDLDPSKPITREQAQGFIDFNNALNSIYTPDAKPEQGKKLSDMFKEKYPDKAEMLDKLLKDKDYMETIEFMNTIKQDPEAYMQMFNDVTMNPGRGDMTTAKYGGDISVPDLRGPLLKNYYQQKLQEGGSILPKPKRF